MTIKLDDSPMRELTINVNVAGKGREGVDRDYCLALGKSVLDGLNKHHIHSVDMTESNES